MAGSAASVAKYLQSVYGSLMPVQCHFFTTGSMGSDVYGNSLPPAGGGAGYAGSNGGAISFGAGGGGVVHAGRLSGGGGGGGGGGNYASGPCGVPGCLVCRPGGSPVAAVGASGYATGGNSFSPPARASAPTPGINGFGEAGEEDFAAGTITGYRWWKLPAPDFRRHPLEADCCWSRKLLSGQCDTWQPGVNEAVCRAGPGAHEEEIPAGCCGCGYWSYWKLSQHSLGGGGVSLTLPVSGVIEGWGRTRVGELGFRCAKARILALNLPFTIIAQACLPQPGWYEAFGSPAAELSPVDADRLEAWMAVIETRLEETYPGVRIFTNQAAMLAKFPLTKGYGR